MKATTAVLLAALCAPAAQAQTVKEAPLVAAQAQRQFFANLSALCGKAFAGKVVADHPKVEGAASAFEGRLVMHVRRCTPREIQIPFHVGDNHSRTWLVSHTGAGLTLKHDHRRKDGSDDASTMYGGHTRDAGWPELQSFPADPYSQESFVRQGLMPSIRNIWQIAIEPGKRFSYRLIRESREFRVDFDLSQPVAPPAAPWGYQD